MRIQIVIINEFGTFQSIELVATKEDYEILIEKAKVFYIEGGFELECDDGSFVVFPPEIVSKSILKVKRLKDV